MSCNSCKAKLSELIVRVLVEERVNPRKFDMVGGTFDEVSSTAASSFFSLENSGRGGATASVLLFVCGDEDEWLFIAMLIFSSNNSPRSSRLLKESSPYWTLAATPLSCMLILTVHVAKCC